MNTKFCLRINMIIGFGYFTAYEDDKIIVKCLVIAFFSLTSTYEKL